MSIMIPAWVNGDLTPVDKLEAHQRGLRHKAVSVFVIEGDKILMQRRAMGKYHTPGLWANTCCTHPDWEEAPLACAQRRLEEELGITGLTPEHRHHLEYRADVGGGLTEHEVVDVFVAEATADMPLDPNPDEVMEVAWIRHRDLLDQIDQSPERFTPWLKIYMSDYAAHIFGTDMLSAVRA
ncbi:isopentenyl-diphosphate Delta-isomerase [Aestuariivita boseongensis]|uniref:isopentenyl-diphosphate Delta-isomerase n=1 Tax=Aestuariivita boseongensis TaxID=1470562 RepID=UPI0006832F19|nr:isopentenyl-diphosphate Delta-isomerase [Aestuariivita boseongensis]